MTPRSRADAGQRNSPGAGKPRAPDAGHRLPGAAPRGLPYRAAAGPHTAVGPAEETGGTGEAAVEERSRNGAVVGKLVEPIHAPRAFEQAIKNIIDGIERAHLRPGDRMPGESELSEQLGVSKPTLRQSLRVLERSGVVRVKRGARGGIFVAADLVPTDVISDLVAVEADSVIDILNARRIIEGAVTEVAALAARKPDFAAIERTIELARSNLDDHGRVLGADAAFHRAVTRACGNRTLERSMMRIAQDLIPIRDAYVDGVQDGPRIVGVHERQLEAMRSRDLSTLASVIDEDFRMLEQAFANAVGREWSQLFGGGHHHFLVRLSSPLQSSHS